MSVPKSLRKEGKLEVQTKMYDLASLTDKMCSNEHIFLKRNRWCITKALVDCIHEAAVNVDIANFTKLNENFAKDRLEYQTRAFRKLIEAETLMEIAYRDNYNENKGCSTIPDTTIVNWLKSLEETRTLVRKWIASDKKRLKDHLENDGSNS